MSFNKKIYIAGHNGMVGKALKKSLKKNGYKNLITKTRKELDLLDQIAVKDFFKNERPDEVYLAAAKVGGINSNNTFPAEFIYENLMIQSNIIHQSCKHGVKKLLFLGSSCIYPKYAKQPIQEDYLLSDKLEPTNEPYAIAKIAGIKMCESYNRQYGKNLKVDYRSVMPSNLYGPGDNYHKDNSHVIPGLIRRFHDAKHNNLSEVSVWGSGNPLREFLFVDDMAAACIHIMNLSKDIYNANTKPMLSHINIGAGEDISIKELAFKIAEVINFKGKIVFNSNKPDGSPRKLMSTKKILDLGWKPSIDLKKGLEITYKDFLDNNKILRK